MSDCTKMRKFVISKQFPSVHCFSCIVCEFRCVIWKSRDSRTFEKNVRIVVPNGRAQAVFSPVQDRLMKFCRNNGKVGCQQKH